MGSKGQVFMALTTLLLLSADLPLQGELPRTLPSPQEASEQAEQLSPEELVDLEIDEEIRDRLRFDPTWRAIAQAVQQDVMIIKWGDGQVQDPIWKRFGTKTFPLLSYYVQSADPTRQAYGMAGIRSLGAPYSTLWLERQIEQGQSGTNFYLLTQDPATLLNQASYTPSYDYDQWKRDFGLDDPQTRDRLIELARANLEPTNAGNNYGQFNLAFLEAMLGYEAVHPEANPPEEEPAPEIPQWDQLAELPQPTEAQVQEAIAYYRSLPPNTQEYILVERLGPVKAGELSPVGTALLKNLAANLELENRMWAIAELNRHGDPEGKAALQEIINGDLSQLQPLTYIVQYDPFYDGDLAKSSHAYFLLVGIAEQYPDSKFIRASREYGDLTGYSYFGSAPRSQEIRDRIANKTSQERMQDWQDWLSRYPDHPGADDATYFLARALEDQNDPVAAMRYWVQMMTETPGDGDASYLAFPHVRTLLDIGLTTQQVETLYEQYQDKAIAPLFRYALAARQAREHNYTEALELSEGLNLTEMPASILRSYYRNDSWFSSYNRQAEIQIEMQNMLTEQRQRWQQLQQLQAENTPESRYQLASNWAGAGGWKNGYLAVWDQWRTGYLPTGSWGNEYCEKFWVCNLNLRQADAVQNSYQQASQNAIALSLYQNLLDDPSTPAELREKTLYMAASTLLWQWENHPFGETLRIHPVAGMSGDRPALNFTPVSDPEADYEQRQENYEQIEQDYLSYLDNTIATLQSEFSSSPYIDDLLFSRYVMSGQPQYLEQIVEDYGEGDRAAEAGFLLEHRPNLPTSEYSW
ncbi:hypothetical protein H6G00_26850 [Leptolyngbya sp. FACHB-541]|nr:hypothetical protein [Leptolyngbya sp. FACHB-541]